MYTLHSKERFQNRKANRERHTIRGTACFCAVSQSVTLRLFTSLFLSFSLSLSLSPCLSVGMTQSFTNPATLEMDTEGPWCAKHLDNKFPHGFKPDDEIIPFFVNDKTRHPLGHIDFLENLLTGERLYIATGPAPPPPREQSWR